MLKTVLAGAAALAIAGSTIVYAQQKTETAPPQRPQMSTEDRSIFLDARIAAIKATLKLTPEQEKNWPPVEAAIRKMAQERFTRAQAMRESRKAGADIDMIDRLRLRADGMAAMSANMKALADAAEPLYKSLDDGQKRRLRFVARFAGPGGGMGGHHGGRHHGMGGPGMGGMDGPGMGGPGMGGPGMGGPEGGRSRL